MKKPSLIEGERNIYRSGKAHFFLGRLEISVKTSQQGEPVPSRNWEGPYPLILEVHKSSLNLAL
jgi:hypothetical protein